MDENFDEMLSLSKPKLISKVNPKNNFHTDASILNAGEE
jgi:hypothetical protein